LGYVSGKPWTHTRQTWPTFYFSVLQWKHGRARRLLASCVAVVGLGSHINTRECSMISLIGSLVILRWFSGARATSAPAAAPAKPTPAMVFRTSLPESTLLPTPGPTFRAEATFLPTRGPTFRAEATVPRGDTEFPHGGIEELVWGLHIRWRGPPLSTATERVGCWFVLFQLDRVDFPQQCMFDSFSSVRRVG